jgi:hypothetical protein
VLLGYGLAGIIAFLIMRQLARWWSTSRWPARSAISPTNTAASGRLHVGLELLGAVRTGQHGRAVGGRHLRPVLVPGDADLGVGAGFFVIINAISLSNVRPSARWNSGSP